MIPSKIVAYIAILSILIQPLAHGYVFTLEREEWLVRNLVGDSLVRTGKIAKGTKLEIPDEFLVRTTAGEIDREATINLWLAKTLPGSPANADSKRSGLFDYGREELGYFIPVKVVETAKGSTQNDQQHSFDGETVMLQVNFLSEEGKWFVNNADAPVVTSPNYGAYRLYIRTTADQTPSIKGATSPCPTTTIDPQSPLGRLASDLQAVLTSIENKRARDVAGKLGAIDNIGKTFNRTCVGLDVKSFMKTVRERAQAEGISWEFLIGKMIDESGGNCRAFSAEKDGDTNAGLFQINADRKSTPGCSRPRDRAWLNKPINNLGCAIEVYKEKVDILVDGGFDPELFRPDNINGAKIVASAYNGGQSHLIAAKKDLETFNSRHGTNYDYRNWDHLKIFMLRGLLSRNTQKEEFGNVDVRRSRTNYIINMAYVEKIFGNGAVPPEQTFAGMARTRWSE